MALWQFWNTRGQHCLFQPCRDGDGHSYSFGRRVTNRNMDTRGQEDEVNLKKSRLRGFKVFCCIEKSVAVSCVRPDHYGSINYFKCFT